METFDPILAELNAVAARLRADLEAHSTPICPPSFERAMSALTFAVGLVEASLPMTRADHNRLTDQITRLETAESRSRRAILNAAANDGDEPPPTPPAMAAQDDLIASIFSICQPYRTESAA